MAIDVDLELYKIFFITAQQGSISAAAKALYISQPAVSRSIKQLEDKLGAPLFIRESRGVKLTANAAKLYSDIRQIYEMLQLAEKDFFLKTRQEEREVRVNATENTIRYCLLPYLQTFSEAYPNTRIKLSNRGTPEALALLKAGKLDVALVTLPAPDAGNLKIRHLFTFHDCFVAGTLYEHLRREPLPLRELLEYPILVLRKGMNSRFYIDKICKRHGLDLKPHMEVESIDTLNQCALSGCGVSFVIREFADKELDSGLIFQVPLQEKIESRSIGIATLNLSLQPHVEAFIDNLIENHRITS